MKIVTSVIDIKESTQVQTSKINRFEQSILDKYAALSLKQDTTNNAFIEAKDTSGDKERKK